MIALKPRAMRALPQATAPQGAEHKPDETARKCGCKEQCPQPNRLRVEESARCTDRNQPALWVHPLKQGCSEKTDGLGRQGCAGGLGGRDLRCNHVIWSRSPMRR